MIKKDDVRILWNVDPEDYKIEDLIVVEFSKNYKSYHLNHEYGFEIGNSNPDWANWDFSDVFIHLFVQNECKCKKSVIKQLLKVEEWQDALNWIKTYWKISEND